MAKKLLILALAAIMTLGIFGLTGCGYPVEKFNSLDDMQEALQGKTPWGQGFYYFDFNQVWAKELGIESVIESGKYEATKKKWRESDAEYTYFRYTIWYKVKYEVDKQIQHRELMVVATDVTHSITFLGKEATQFEPVPDLDAINTSLGTTDANCMIGYAEKTKRLLLTFSLGDDAHNCWYYFVLDGVQHAFVANEAERFVAISKIAIDSRYKK